MSLSTLNPSLPSLRGVNRLELYRPDPNMPPGIPVDITNRRVLSSQVVDMPRYTVQDIPVEMKPGPADPVPKKPSKFLDFSDVMEIARLQYLKKSIASGAINAAVDKFVIDKDGKMWDTDVLATFGLQSVSSYSSAHISDMIMRQMIRSGMGEYALDMTKPDNARVVNSVITGIVYALGSKYLLGKDKNTFKMLLASALSEFAAQYQFGLENVVEKI